jgi:hypothetical protein
VNQRRKPRVAGLRAPKQQTPKRAGALTWWHRIGKGPKWLAVTALPLLLAAVIPGAAPWVTDQTRDLFGQQPLTARGQAHPDVIAGQYWATEAMLTDPVSHEIYATIRNSGGVQMGTSGQRVTLESNRAARIDIDRITAVVEQRRAPLAGTAFIADPQGSAEGLLVEFHLDAGTEVPALVADQSGDPTKAMLPYSGNGKIRYVEQGKPEHLVIRASTAKCYCQWRVRIEYSYRGTRGQLVVPPPGEPPFATTGWVSHKIEYNMHTAEGGGPQRHDCTQPAARCRDKP